MVQNHHHTANAAAAAAAAAALPARPTAVFTVVAGIIFACIICPLLSSLLLWIAGACLLPTRTIEGNNNNNNNKTRRWVRKNEPGFFCTYLDDGDQKKKAIDADTRRVITELVQGDWLAPSSLRELCDKHDTLPPVVAALTELATNAKPGVKCVSE